MFEAAAPQLLSARQMAAQIGKAPATIIRATQDGRIRPDFTSDFGRLLFQPARRNEIAAALDHDPEPASHAA